MSAVKTKVVRIPPEQVTVGMYTQRPPALSRQEFVAIGRIVVAYPEAGTGVKVTWWRFYDEEGRFIRECSEWSQVPVRAEDYVE